MSGNAVVSTDAVNLPVEIEDILSSYEGAGADFERNEVRMPQLKKLQKNSNYCDEASEDYIDGATPGCLYYTDTGDISDRMFVIPIVHATVITAIRDYDKGGGIEGVYRPGAQPTGDQVVQMEGEPYYRLAEDPEVALKESMQYIVLVVNGNKEVLGEAIMRFSSTDLKFARTWNTRIKARRLKGKRAPAFFFAYPVQTIKTQFTMRNGKKTTIFNWDIKHSEAEFVGSWDGGVDLLRTLAAQHDEADLGFFYREATQRAADDDDGSVGGSAETSNESTKEKESLPF
tara:strand:+ start:6175 stop:7035 length:861 start_codon:yes stop_codon:yes gene_type:complete